MRSSSQIVTANTQLFCSPDVLPVANSTVSEHWRDKSTEWHNPHIHAYYTGVLASEGWWEAWQPSQGNQELLVVRDKVGRLPGELGVSKSMECDIFLFSALTLLVGRQDGHPACKKLGVGLLVVIIWQELCTTYSSSCHHHLRHPLLQ